MANDAPRSNERIAEATAQIGQDPRFLEMPFLLDMKIIHLGKRALTSLPEFFYTVLLKPAPLRAATNAALRSLTPVMIERYGARVYLNPQDPVVSGALALSMYEKPETRFFQKVISPGMTFLDIGANVGYCSAMALARVGPLGRVIAVEPEPNAFTFLRRTILANGVDRADLVHKALGDAPATLRLYRNPDNGGDNRLYSNDLADSFVEVEVARADDVLFSLGVDLVDFIKLDVPGYEDKVFAGLEQTIRRSSSLVILTEFWPWGLEQADSDPLELLKRLQGLGLFSRETDE